VKRTFFVPGLVPGVVVLGLLAAASPARADDAAKGMDRTDKGTLGIGIIVGEPTGISGRLYLKDDQAIQAAIGGSFIGGGIQIHADYVFHPFILQSRESFVLAAYVGPGVRFIQYSTGRNDSYIALGLRGVGGLLFDFKEPLDAFVEVAGVLEYGFAADKHGGIALNAGAGVRYYF
jgi:hypothetical protein